VWRGDNEEVTMTSITVDTLRALADAPGQPKVSILLDAPSGGGPRRLRELIEAASSRLPPGGERWLEPVGERVAESWPATARGFAAYASPEHLTMLELAEEVGDALHVNDRFHLQPLLANLAASERVVLVEFAEHSVAAYRCRDDRLDPLPVAELPPPEDAGELVHYLHEVDGAVAAAVPGRHGPVVATGPGETVRRYAAITRLTDVTPWPHDAPFDDETERLREARRALERHQPPKADVLVAQLGARLDRGRASVDPIAIATAVPGRIGTLLIAPGHTGDRPVDAESLIRHTLAGDGDVVVVDARALPAPASVAALFRY
jgi:hypothetical protein